MDSLPRTRRAALAVGSLWYFTGKPCKRGHIAERRTNYSTCRECEVNHTQETNCGRRARTAASLEARIVPSLPLVSLQDARDQGLPRYFTGLPCKHGHVAERDVRYGRCQGCELVRNIERAGWRLKNPESALVAQNRHRKTEKFRLVSRVRESRKRALKKSVTLYPIPQAALTTMLESAKVCPDCGRLYSKKRPRTIDHVVALAAKGSHAITNFRVICRSCNSSKGAKSFTSNGQGMLL